MRTKPNRLALSVAAALFAATLSGTANAAGEAALFRKADANKNGKLSRQEFPGFIRSLAANGNGLARTVRFLGVYGMAFRISDKNKDGQLTGAELQRAARRERGPRALAACPRGTRR